MIDSAFIRYSKELAGRNKKIICLPYAGGGASSYINWQDYFGSAVQVLPIQLPGHEDRMDEELVDNCKNLAALIADDIEVYISDAEFAIFGHSMGGIIAFELERILENKGYQAEFCVISSTDMSETNLEVKSSILNDEDFLKKVFEYGAMDEDNLVLQYPEFREIFVNILRADFNIVESYAADGYKVNCPLIALCGDGDPKETLSNMHSWEEYTYGNVTYQEYPGGHFYLNEYAKKVCDMIKIQFELK